MTKKNILPKQAAPVQRDTNATSSGEKGIVPALSLPGPWNPFAGDDAE